MSAQPCGCDPECQTPEHNVTIVTPQGEVSELVIVFHECEEFPDCSFGRGFIAGAFGQ